MYVSVWYGSQEPPPRTVPLPPRARPCTQPIVTVVEVIIVVPSVARVGSYLLLQCCEGSEYGHKAYDYNFEVFHMLLANDGEPSPQVRTFNMLLHDDARATKVARSIGSARKHGCYPRWS
jgi:hypothetical protein